MRPASFLAALAIGISLGLLGGGGSILTVPALVYWAGLPPVEATTSSLVVVGLTSFSAALQHLRRLQPRAALLFAAAGVPGSYAGSVFSRAIPPRALLISFAVLMAIAGLAMIARREYQPAGKVSTMRIAGAGLLVGLLTGLLGVGGGFLIVPALVLFAGLSMAEAVGTSVAVIALNCTGGLLGRLGAVGTVNWSFTLGFTGIAIAGSFAGAALTGHLGTDRLRLAFGVFVLALAAYMLANNLPGSS